MSLYRALPFDVVRLGFKQDLLRFPIDSGVSIVPRETRVKLELCRNFKSLEDHNREIRRVLRLPDSETEAIRNVLSELVSTGLLISESTLLERKSAQAHPYKEPITNVAIVTANRPQNCTRTILSIVENLRCYGRSMNLIVMDDSRDRRTRETLELIAGQIGTRYSVSYAGRVEKEQYVGALARLGIDRDVARFALLGEVDDGLTAVGANRNCVLLETVGERIISNDDDVMWQATVHPQHSSGIRVCSHLYPRDIWPFRSRAEIAQTLKWQAIDVVGEHERVLGESLQGLVASDAMERQLTWEDTCNHVVQQLLSGTGSILASMTGIGGDCGGNSAKWMLTCFGQIRAEMLKSRENYDLALTSREILTVARETTLTHLPFCQTTNIGLDNRDVLPPFFPVGTRGEDTIFGILVMCCFPEACFSHLPYALFHDAELGRSYDDHPQFRFAELMTFLISSFQYSSRVDRKRALQLLGRFLEELASAPPAEFWDSVATIVRKQQGYWMQGWEVALNSSSEYPDYWRQDVLAMHAERSRMLMQPDEFVPAELRRLHSLDEAKRCAQEILLLSGRLLYIWPDILDAAAFLKSSGVRVSVPVGVPPVGASLPESIEQVDCSLASSNGEGRYR